MFVFLSVTILNIHIQIYKTTRLFSNDWVRSVKHSITPKSILKIYINQEETNDTMKCHEVQQNTSMGKLQHSSSSFPPMNSNQHIHETDL